VAIALGLKANPHLRLRLACVDLFFSDKQEPGLLEAFRANAARAGVADLIDCIAQPSAEAAQRWPAQQGVAMLWIDGNHDFEHVRDDFLAWNRFLVPGGVVAFHDLYLLGVRETVLKHLFPDARFQDLALIADNLLGAVKGSLPPSRAQRVQKQRVYWALRIGTTNPWWALAYALWDGMNRPYGHLGRFLTEHVPVQKT
jgi:hypothetical protein